MTTRLERLATDLAELSTVEEGCFPIHIHSHDLSQDVETVAADVRSQFAAKHVELALTVLPPVPIRGDQNRIIRILANIIGDALSYTPQGGTVAVTGSADATTASISITDTGRGLTKDQMSAVFDRFYRADRCG